MHPSKAISGRHSKLLEGRRIIIGVSGSIAAVEIPRIARELIRHGAEVRVVMTAEATRLLTPEAVEFATGHPPITALTGAVEHVTHLGPGEERADLLLLAPATANTIGKVAHGIDDTAVTSFASMALGGGVPILLAPAMHGEMARNPAVVESLERLRRFGVELLGPRREEGEEKIASPEEVAAAVLHRLARSPWAGRRILIIGGASREPIDDVRSITNASSGATAVALAREAYYRGATVHLWLGGVEVAAPPLIEVVRWGSVESLLKLIHTSSFETPLDAVWVPAALADYTISPVAGKIESRGRAKLELHLRQAPRALPELRSAVPYPALLVAFKLLSGQAPSTLIRRARLLQRESGADWVVANDAVALAATEATWWAVGRHGAPRKLRGPKAMIAGALLDFVGSFLSPTKVERSPRPSKN